MVTPVNTRLRDETLARLIDMQRYAAGEARRMLSLLNAADSELFARLTIALSELGDTGAFAVQRLSAALNAVWEVNEAVYRQLATRSAEQMAELTREELRYTEEMFRTLLPRSVSEQALRSVISQDAVYAAATARPMRGRLMSEWWERMPATRRDRIETSLRIGFVSGRTVDEMVRDLRGTRAENYEDGALNEDRRSVEAVVRTAVSHYASEARAAFYERNSDLIESEQWLSTLDNRTTPECQIRDKLLYTADEDHKPIGHKIPWGEGPGRLHWQCRSTSVPVVRSAEILGFELPPVERAAMNGVAAPGTDFRAWIESQPESRQREILGPKRAALLASGELSFRQLFSAEGDWLTLEELKARHPG